MSKFSIEICEAIRSVLGDSEYCLHKPQLDHSELDNLKICIETSFVSSVGEYVDKFENMLSNFTKSECFSDIDLFVDLLYSISCTFLS